MTHLYHDFLKFFYCSLLWRAQSGLQTLLHGRFFSFPSVATLQELCCCVRPSQVPFQSYVFERLLYAIHACHGVGVRRVFRSSHLTVHETKFRHSLCSPFSLSVPCPCQFSMATLFEFIIFVKPSRNLQDLLCPSSSTILCTACEIVLFTVPRTSTVLSCIGHKEWRFCQLVSVMHMFATRSLLSLHDCASLRYSLKTTVSRIKRTHVVLLALLASA